MSLLKSYNDVNYKSFCLPVELRIHPHVGGLYHLKRGYYPPPKRQSILGMALNYIC